MAGNDGNPSDETSRREKTGLSKGAVYRQLRLWHGYLSALAFIALLFFSFTGVLLNHPGWLRAEIDEPVETSLMLSEAERAAIAGDAEPARALALLVAERAAVTGAFRDGDRLDADVFVRMQGVRGFTDIHGNLETGDVIVTVEREHPVAVLNALHRAEHAGPVWRFLVDAIGVLFIIASLAGLALFFTLRFRLRTALALTAASLIVMGGVFVFAVP